MAANTIQPAGTLAQLQSYLFSSTTGIALTSASYSGSLSAAGVFDSLSLSSDLQLGRGVLLTSGVGVPPQSNTQSSFGSSLGLAGDPDLTTFAKAAFAGTNATYDASVLTLTFTVTNPDIHSIKFDVALGSEEYPEYVDSYVDIGAVWTGTGASATNYALVNGNPLTPLSVTSANVTLGNFINNTQGGLPIEYNGLIGRQSIFVPVHMGQNVIKIGVADTNDHVLDTGLFISGIEGSSSSTGGTFQEIPVSVGGSYDAGSGNNLFTGSAAQFNNTTISNFSDLDQIFVKGSFFSDTNALLGYGSLDLFLDTDNNGSKETHITLADPVENSTVHIAPGPTGTTITISPLSQPTTANDVIQGTAGLDYIAGGAGNDTLRGLAGSDVLVGGPGNDLLEGGPGIDTAGFAGQRAGFQVTFDAATDSYTIVDINPADGNEGTDTLKGVEFVSFHGTEYAIGSLVAVPTLGITATNATHAEGDGGASQFTFTVTRVGDTASAVSVHYAVSGSGADAATASDFVGGALPQGTVSFAANETSKTITVSVLGDKLAEADEGFTVALSNPANGAVIATSKATGVIQNDDVANLNGGNGSDLLKGGSLNDILHGGNASDQLFGLAGDDRLFGDNGDDTLEGGPGKDALYGGNGTDKLSGGDGDDKLFGDKGDDALLGGAGKDLLEGGHGNDTLTGGLDSDTFVISKGGGADIVTDFNFNLSDGNHDWLSISGLTFKSAAEIDVNHDGLLDTVLRFNGAELTLLGTGHTNMHWQDVFLL